MKPRISDVVLAALISDARRATENELYKKENVYGYYEERDILCALLDLRDLRAEMKKQEHSNG